MRETGKPPEQNLWYFLLLNILGRSLAAQGKEPEAGELLTQARASVLSATDAADARRHELRRTAELYERLKRPEVARLYRAALEHLEKVTKGQGVPAGPQVAPSQASPPIASGG